MSFTYFWFQIDQLPFFSRVIGAAGLLGIMAWSLSFPLILVRRCISRIVRMKDQHREWLAIKVNQWRASNHWGFLFASVFLQDFKGRAHSFLLAQYPSGAIGLLIPLKERQRLGQDALFMLRMSTSQETRIYALKVLALIQPQGAWKAITPFMKRPESLEFISAAKALLAIDMQRALRMILRVGMKHMAVNRHVWGQLIEGLPPRIVEEAFIYLLVEGGFEGEARLIALMPYLGEGGRLMPLRSFVPIQNRMAWLTMAIRLVDAPFQMPLVRPYLEHPNSLIRFYAARAIGKFGDPSDLPSLKRMMFRGSPSVRSAATSAYISIIGRIAAPSFPEQEAIAQ